MAPRKPRILLGFLTLAVLLGLVALGLSVQNALDLGRQADQREKDRIASDVRSCERGNDLRRQIVAIGQAEEDLVAGILDTIYGFVADTPAEDARLDPLRAAIAPLFAAHQTALDEITLTDCPGVTPGAKETP